MNIAVEAWMDRTRPIEVATPIYQHTATTITFTVLQASRTALNLTGYVGKFSLMPVDTETILVDKAITIVTAASGVCTVALTAANLSLSKECIGELRLWSAGVTTGDVSHRVQFRFYIAKSNIQGATA